MNKLVSVGFARKCITPPLGTAISGYFEPRHAKGVHDELYVSATAFDDGKNRAVVLACDLCGMKNQYLLDGYKKMISEFCNIPAEAVIVTCSHTHTGPIVGDDESSGEKSNPAYDEYLGLMLRDAAAMAFADTSPARFYTAEGKCHDVAFVRIYRMADGSVRTNPPLGSPDILNPIAEADETVYVLKITREGKEDILMVNFGVHADTIGGEIISADHMGFMRETLENALPDTKAVFLQGAEGDINTRNVHITKPARGLEYSRSIGRSIAGAVLASIGDAEEIEISDVAYANMRISIPTNRENHRIPLAEKVLKLHREERDDEIDALCGDTPMNPPEAIRILRLADGPDAFEFTLSAIKLGNIAIAGLPGEPFCEIGKRVRNASPFDKTFVCVLTDGGETYFPTGTVYDERCYESTSTPIKKGADDILVNNMTKLLNNLR